MANKPAQRIAILEKGIAELKNLPECKVDDLYLLQLDLGRVYMSVSRFSEAELALLESIKTARKITISDEKAYFYLKDQEGLNQCYSELLQGTRMDT